MLGLLHRTMLGVGPPHFEEFFYREVDGKLREYDSRENQHPLAWVLGNGQETAQDFVVRSALGLPRVYNTLPQDVTMGSPSVSEFQTKLQDMVCRAAQAGLDNWRQLLSPRSGLVPLRRLLEQV